MPVAAGLMPLLSFFYIFQSSQKPRLVDEFFFFQGSSLMTFILILGSVLVENNQSRTPAVRLG
jgi:hypothetical protein